MALRPINRIKHVVDFSQTQTAGANLSLTLITASDTPDLASTTEVATGSRVNGIYLKVEVSPNETDAGAIPNVYMAIFKSPGGSIAAMSPNSIGSQDNKRFVIHQEMIMMNNLAGGNPRIMFNGVIALPKGYRRFGPNDLLRITLLSPAVNFAVCIQCHYKEFR